MDINILVGLFEQVGLTACVIGAFAWYIVKKDKDKALVDKEIRERQMAERNMLIETIKENKKHNEATLKISNELAEANRIMLHEFKAKINNIENSVIKIEQKLS